MMKIPIQKFTAMNLRSRSPNASEGSKCDASTDGKKNVIAAIPTAPVSACAARITSSLPDAMNNSATIICDARNAVRSARRAHTGAIDILSPPPGKKPGSNGGGAYAGVHVAVGSIPNRISSPMTKTTFV
eukprot:31457-Pelagococcus_subviridis.AAC.27